MKIESKVFRFHPAAGQPGQFVDYTVTLKPGMSVLELLHQIHDEQDGTLAYRYSCRGAICGTCAVKVNGIARLACKTQVHEILSERDVLTIGPLTHFGVIKDLVVDQRPFWETIHATMPWLVREKDMPDEHLTYESTLDKMHLDQLHRAADCIKCSCCYADCPRVDDAPEFFGPAAAIQIYKQMYDPRDQKKEDRKQLSAAEGGVFACDNHAVCIKVCPKDCRPLRAITFIQREIQQQD